MSEDSTRVLSNVIRIVAVAFGRLLRNPLRKLRARWPSVLRCPITAATAGRRLFAYAPEGTTSVVT